MGGCISLASGNNNDSVLPVASRKEDLFTSVRHAHPDQPFVPANASNFIIHSAEHSTYTHISLTPFCIHQYSIITLKENEKETSFDKNSHKQGKNLLGRPSSNREHANRALTVSTPFKN